MGSVDLDSHVIENDETWSYLDPSERQYRPRTVVFPDARTEGLSRIWLVGDSWARRMPEDGDLRGIGNVWETGLLDGTDLTTRAETIDLLGIDVQMVHSTFWIGAEVDHPLEEAALCRSFNRWMADHIGRNPRFPWTLRPPLRLLDRAIEEMEFGKANGACGIFLRGLEHGMFLCDPYFFPMYEKAQDLDLAVIVHAGIPTRRTPSRIGELAPFPTSVMPHWMALMSAFYGVIDPNYTDVYGDLSTHFPRLRWGFVEGGASWAPFVLDLKARQDGTDGGRPLLDIERMSPEELATKNVYFMVTTGEDLPYLAQVLGEDVLGAGTDYGHNDPASHLGSHTWVLEHEGLDPRVARKIVDDNGRRLVGADPAFRPAPRDRAERGMDLPHVRGAAGNNSDGRPAIFTPEAHSTERGVRTPAQAWLVEV
jgi:predicted TIM-barrel fold metal-dependent hydrolase